MQRLLAIALLTVKAAFRYRLVVVLSVLLLGTVIGLPLIIKHDGSARGFTQILMTYTLSLITTLLGFATLWLACGTMARDVEECQMQMVAVKPIARWQIWLGKWVGIMMLNAMLLGVSAVAVFGIMQWRARHLPPEQQEVLRNEVLVARGSLKEPQPDIQKDVELNLKERLKKAPVMQLDLPLLRNQITEQVKWQYQLVPPGYLRKWVINLGFRKNFLKDQPLYLRVKFHTPETRDAAEPKTSISYDAFWEIGPPDSPLRRRNAMRLSPATFHEFQIPPNMFDANGDLTISFINQNETVLLFPLDEGMEVLYREGSFGLNFSRGIGIIFCWLGLLAALGLTAASFLSFPVASFFALGFLIVGLSSSTLSTVVQEGGIFGVNHEGGPSAPNFADKILVPIFQVLLKLVNLVQGFSPIDSLSLGRSITWEQLGLAIAQIVLLMGGIMAAIGIVIFTRRELATAQSNN
ncbi:MAG: hypothetical protein HY043_22545 [Verrucomicrobia bacterium]|nr:hypothetical protein [Verrucomicrobiota bacterium]